MITISRDGQQFGPYTLEDAQAHLASGALLPTDLAWYEGAPGWIPLPDVPGMSGQPVMDGQHDPLAAANPAVAAAGAVASAAEKGSKKKMIMIAAGSVVGVCAIAAAVWFLVLKEDAESGGNGGGNEPIGGADSGLTFSGQIKPLFEDHGCYDCHDGADPGDKANTALNLQSNDSIMGVITAGDPENSKLIKVISADPSSDERMPPKGEMMPSTDVEKVKAWIKAGAKP